MTTEWVGMTVAAARKKNNDVYLRGGIIAIGRLFHHAPQMD
jgi:hypothetical protein